MVLGLSWAGVRSDTSFLLTLRFTRRADPLDPMILWGFWVKWVLWGLERSPQATQGRAHGEWFILDLMRRRYAGGAAPAPSGSGK